MDGWTDMHEAYLLTAENSSHMNHVLLMLY